MQYSLLPAELQDCMASPTPLMQVMVTHFPPCPHPQPPAGKLLMLLQQGKRMVQEGALTALASVADCSQEEFVRYYDSVMPLLSNIMLNAQQKEHRWGQGGQRGT
jgi:hypothetical protein